MDDETKKETGELLKRVDELERQLGMRKEAMGKDEIRKKIAEARAWLNIVEESQATRQKHRQGLATDFELELGNDAASARAIIDKLEKEVYGGFLGALRKRVENVERAMEEQEEAKP